MSAEPKTYEWQDEAACTFVEPNIFFLEGDMSADAAKAVCAMCPVQPDCLEHALKANEKEGVWGGKTPLERRSLQRLRLKQAAKRRREQL